MKEQERTEEPLLRQCRAEYPSRDPRARIVRCGLIEHGRHVDHEEEGTGITWAWTPPPPPRVWSLPAEPGSEVTAVRCDCHGTWTVDDLRWWQLTRPKLASMGAYRMHWFQLVRSCLPLTDATPTEETK